MVALLACLPGLALAAGTQGRSAANVYVAPQATDVDASAVASANFDNAYGTLSFRCGQQGVLVCQSFDDSSVFVNASGTGGGYGSGLYPSGQDGQLHGVRDTATKFEGAGSLRFDIRAGANGGPGGSPVEFTTLPAGEWRSQFGPDGQATRIGGDNSKVYIQFSYRLSPEMLTFDWPSLGGQGWKSFIVFGPYNTSSCTSDQFVQENSNQKNILIGYTHCSAPSLRTQQSTPYNYQQGKYSCPYGTNYATDPTCLRYQSDTWITEYWVVHIGQLGTASTTFEAYASFNRGPFEKFIGLTGFTLGDYDPNHNLANYVGLQTILLTPYFSGITTTHYDYPAASVWYDSLIVSTSPIMMPGGFHIGTTPGWYEVPDSWLWPCPTTTYSTGITSNICTGLIDAWNGGAMDTKRHRLLLHGGGHQDYRGNEVWAINTADGTTQKFIEASDVACGVDSLDPASYWQYGTYLPIAATTARSASGTTATLTLSDASHSSLVAGRTVTIQGMGNASYNKAHAILTAVNRVARTVSYTIPATTETTTADTGGQIVDEACEYYPDGRPSARHNYEGLVYVGPRAGDANDYMYELGGSLNGQGLKPVRASFAIWRLNLVTNQWESMWPYNGTVMNSAVQACAYHAAYGSIYCWDEYNQVNRYELATNTMDRSASRSGNSGHASVAIDPARNQMLIIGDSTLYRANLAPPGTPQAKGDNITSSTFGCATMLAQQNAGFVYDPVDQTFVAWNGGDTVWRFHPDSLVCDTLSYSFGPGANAPWGAFSHFQYDPYTDGFIVVTNYKRNAFILKTR
ncbi:MAG: hypothetical protein HY749_16230 [Gammaproteobacteria bacterium]|nr:hypothetical protein [Gammaproteobacteria bacterium]